MVPLLVIVITYANILIKIFHQSHGHVEIFNDEAPRPPLLRWRTSLQRQTTCNTDIHDNCLTQLDNTGEISTRQARPETTKDLLRRNRQVYTLKFHAGHHNCLTFI